MYKGQQRIGGAVEELRLHASGTGSVGGYGAQCGVCLLYTSDAADDLLCGDLGGRRSITQKNHRSGKRRAALMS